MGDRLVFQLVNAARAGFHPRCFQSRVNQVRRARACVSGGRPEGHAIRATFFAPDGRRLCVSARVCLCRCCCAAVLLCCCTSAWHGVAQFFACDALRAVSLLATFQCILVTMVAECLLLQQHWKAYAVLLAGLFVVLVVCFLKGYRAIALAAAGGAGGSGAAVHDRD